MYYGDCTFAEITLYNDPSLSEILKLNAYQPEPAKLLINYADNLCNLLKTFPSNCSTNTKKIIGQLQEVLKAEEILLPPTNTEWNLPRLF